MSIDEAGNIRSRTRPPESQPQDGERELSVQIVQSLSRKQLEEIALLSAERIGRAESRLALAREHIARLEDIAQGVIDEYSECVFDESRPSLQYCFTHSTKRCTAKKTYEMAGAALAATQPTEGEK